MTEQLSGLTGEQLDVLEQAVAIMKQIVAESE
ncbi:Uncharacterised protein [Mycobacteroides abscessus subsp. abscessus]|nr:Uncharacterised protein [Mycobacteroides abscessus subsp. abscessus]